LSLKITAQTDSSNRPQFSTLERNMAEVAEQNRRSERELRGATVTLDRRSHYGGAAAACDTWDRFNKTPFRPKTFSG
jgi:hypothetical protein